MESGFTLARNMFGGVYVFSISFVMLEAFLISTAFYN
jgi:hypothetical protein